MSVERGWVVEFNNGRIMHVRAESLQKAICKAIENLTRATRVKEVHEVSA